MNKLMIAAPLALSLVAGCAGKNTGMADLAPEVSQELDAEVMSGIEDNILPGGVLVYGRGDTVLKFDTYGHSQTEPAPAPMTRDAVFDMASVSKVAGTATMTMLLIEDGKLSPETRVSEIFPEYAAEGKDDVKVANLLTHTSGLKPYENWKTAEQIRGDGTEDAALFARIASLPKQYPTGEYVNYSCLNYLSLARLNEQVAGESMESFLRRRVWEPLGMDDTTYHPTEAQFARLAPPFRKWPDDATRIHDPLANYYSVDAGHCSGNAGLYSTADDMARYIRMIVNGGEFNGVRVMKPETVDMMTSVHARLPKWSGDADDPGETWKRGYGWHVYSDAPWTHPAAPEDAVIGHTGYTGTFVWADKSTDTWLVFLSNSVYTQDPPKTSTVRRKLTGTILESVYGPVETQTASSD